MRLLYSRHQSLCGDGFCTRRKVPELPANNERSGYAPMFEEFIAHGNDMIRRLERLVDLSYQQLTARPAHEQVAPKEGEAWMKTVRGRIVTGFGQDTVARYDLINELWSDEIRRQAGREI